MKLKQYLNVNPDYTFKHGIALRLIPNPTKIALISLVIVILVALGIIRQIDRMAYSAQTEIALETLHRVSGSQAAWLVHQLDAEIVDLEALSQTEHIQASLLAASQIEEGTLQEDSAVTQDLDEFRRLDGQITSAALISADKGILSISPAPTEGLKIDPNKWDWFAQPIETQSPYITGMLTGDGLTGASGVHIAIPVPDKDASDKLLGVLYVVIDPIKFNNPVSDPNAPYMVVYAQDGKVIIPPFSLEENIIHQEGISPTILGEMTSQRTGGYDEVRSPIYDRLYGYVTIADLDISDSAVGQLPWIVATQQVKRPVANTIVNLTKPLRGVIGIGAALIGICFVLITLFFSHPLLTLTDSAQKMVKSDDLEYPIPTYPATEVGALSNVLRRLVDRVRHQNTQLKVAVEVSRESLSLTIDALLTQITHTLGERSGYRGVAVYVVESGSQRAQVSAIWGTVGEGMTRLGNVVVAGKSTLVGRVLAEGREYRDPGLASAFAGVAEKPDQLAIPFGVKSQGVLHVVGNMPNLFTEGDIDIFRIIANQIGFVLDNRFLLAEVEAAKEEAEKATRVKSQFLANMSHELRTPLNAILNFSGFVMDGDVGPVSEEQRDLLAKVNQSGEHLLNLINDILDLSKIEADMMQLLIEDVDMSQVLYGTASVAKGLVTGKQLEFLSQIEDNLPIIRGDKRRLRQVFLNIVSNAIKFTAAGSVTLEARREMDNIHISVQDTGMGIAPEEQHLVFEAFKQAKHDFEVGGTGLGMVISKHFVEAHGGKIWFESTLGTGTTFHVMLPIETHEEKSVVDAATA